MVRRQSLTAAAVLCLTVGACTGSNLTYDDTEPTSEPSTTGSTGASVEGQTTLRRQAETTTSNSQSVSVSNSSTVTGQQTSGESAPESTEQTVQQTTSEQTPATSESTAGSGSTDTTSETSATLDTSDTTPETVLATRTVPVQEFSPMAVFAEVQVLHPSEKVERVGFHESNHDGARQFEVEPTAVAPLVLESRERGTGSRTAIDVVVDPASEIRAPVTGTVLRAGGYVLYCKHNDDFVVIEPDSHPGWELKVLHISGVQVTKGQRVEAGVTVLAPGPTQLPFDSQVDEFTSDPSWPHVHIELVDPSIPDRPSTGGGC